MNRKRSLFIAAVLSLGLASAALRATESAGPTAQELWEREYGATHDERMQWWRDARFGMFIHWGVYAVPAGIWQDERVTVSGAEWIMNRGRIPVADYRQFTKQFNPLKFNADEWVQLAKDAGMKYIVITSKHHDGFAMYHSKASRFNIVDATPFDRDPLKELAEACRRHGLKLGFYYSQAQDWNHPGGAAASSRTGQPVIDEHNHWDPAQQGDMDEYLDTIALPQVKELLSGDYGEVAILWWDTPVGMNIERVKKFLPLLKLQPHIISNNRLDAEKSTGDFSTPEQKIPATGIPGKDWETCMTINRTWGYRSYDHDWKSTETLLRNLINIASKGGNYLLNIGPTADGLIPGPSIVRLREVGAWMKVNGEALYGTTASPFSRLPWGRCTTKLTDDGAILYLHVFNWPADGKLLVPGLKNAIESATMLAGGRKLTTARADGGVVLTVPVEAPDKISSTIVLRIQGAPDVAQLPLMPDYDGSLTLTPSDAVTHGPLGKRFEDNHDLLGPWADPRGSAEWKFTIPQPGKYFVEAELGSMHESTVEIHMADQKLVGKSPANDRMTRFNVVEFGEIEFKLPGEVSLRVKAVADGWKTINVRDIILKPVSP